MITESVGKDTFGAKVNHISCLGLEIDIVYAQIDEVIAECAEYAAAEHRYPTRYHRGKKEMEGIVQCHKEIERPGFLREMVMRVYLADQMIDFEKDAAFRNYEKLKNGLRLIDIWDDYFSHAVGNYEEKIRDRNMVLRRKYLYCISQIMLCHSILKETRKPVMNFSEYFYKGGGMLLPYIEHEIRDVICQLWEQNRELGRKKEEDYVCADLQLNKWIESNLNRLADGMLEQERRLKDVYLPFDRQKIDEQ